MDKPETVSVRTLLISDAHLGGKHARPAELLEFLRGFRPEQLYIVGDFIDGWKFNAGWRWTRDCDLVVRHILDWSARGCKVRYVPGNHDSFLRNPAFQSLAPMADVEVADEFVFHTRSGWTFLVTHGDAFDFFETRAVDFEGHIGLLRPLSQSELVGKPLVVRSPTKSL